MYALSYDEVDAVADYARTHEITFPLLSDPDSEIIERFGILNTLIDADDHPWYGIPYPGAYVMDSSGTITAKFFESSLLLRPSAEQLLRAALGDVIHLPVLDAPAGQVAFDVTLDGDVLRAGVMHDLIVRFAVPDGQHLYGEPVPEGMIATSVEIEPDVGLVVKPAVLPPTSPHTLAGTGETLQVYEGDVLVRLPITQLGRSLTRLDDGSFVQRLSGTVRWQSCDDDMCHLPRTERFSIDVPAARHDGPGRENAREGGMDIATHLSKMIGRHTDKSLAQVLGEMSGDIDSR